MGDEKIRVAVLGGGVGAMTAAFALTATPEGRAKYDVTVYQMGWRLGGKGASGRCAADAARIEEHGLHVWSGFYDNAIAQMKSCLAELQDAGADGTFRSFEEAFIPHGNIALGDMNDGWSFWPMEVARNPAEPGSGGTLLTPWDYLVELVNFLRGAFGGDAPVLVGALPEADMTAEPSGGLSPELIAHVAHRTGLTAGAAGISAVDGIYRLMNRLPETPPGFVQADHDALSALSRRAQQDIRQSRLSGGAPDAGTRQFLVALELAATVLRGMIEDRVYRHGFDAIDGEEISQWLARHGARPDVVNSPLVRAVYDYAFGYRHGLTDPSHRAIAAGVFIKGSMRLFFTYKGAIFFKMRAGMGDTIFTPYYKALNARGVKFRFFHKVRALQLADDGRAVGRIVVDRQATVKSGAYDPFVRVPYRSDDGAPALDLDCWPSEPFYDQLVEGAELRRRGVNLESAWTDWTPVETLTLRRGVDFDEVILGISLGGLPDVAQELIAADPAWKRMVDKVETAATQAMQLWLRPGTRALGWEHGDSILTAYADEMNTWADMTHLDAAEAWGAEDRPGSIAYFCGPLPDPVRFPPYSDAGFPARATAQVMEYAREWMAEHGARIWPDAFDGKGGFDDAALISRQPPGPAGMWETQYFRANYEPTERYVLSVPWSTSARLRADRSGFGNLWLAGDWTYTGINAGCVEAAAMSGLRAAAGLAGLPVDIVGEEADPVPGEPCDYSRSEKPMAPVLQSIRAQNSPWPWSSLYGMAQTTGATVTLPFPRDHVAAMLPAGLEPAPQTLTGPAEHPVILLFARQRNVRPNQLPFGWNYCEFICAVPWARHTDPRLQDLPPLIVPTRLYLDSLPPILLGIWGYGFPKLRATICADLTSYVVRDAKTDREIVSCSFEREGAEVLAHQITPFEAVRPAYEMAMVTRNRIGQWQYSVYDFSLGQALLQPLKMEIRISSDALGLPEGQITAPPISASPFGGAFLTSDATINNPLQSFELRDMLRKRHR
ncbi:NAD(P)-binding protein [Tropicimonas sp.]|uniref:NAD(P)-binding protein n=1 Tax=Tropicimonas sp. TaxID=2067044 RepID=UPI003A88DB8E